MVLNAFVLIIKWFSKLQLQNSRSGSVYTLDVEAKIQNVQTRSTQVYLGVFRSMGLD